MTVSAPLKNQPGKAAPSTPAEWPGWDKPVLFYIKIDFKPTIRKAIFMSLLAVRSNFVPAMPVIAYIFFRILSNP